MKKSKSVIGTWVSKGEIKRIQIMNPDLFDQVARSLGYKKLSDIDFEYPHEKCVKKSKEHCFCIHDFVETMKYIIKEY